MAASLAAKRLQKEVGLMQELKKEQKAVGAEPVDLGDLSRWEGWVVGPEGSPYEGGTFKVELIFPQTYPLKPPQMKFLTKVYHMNISTTGYICLSTLKTRAENGTWSPAVTVGKLLLAVQSLMGSPNPDDPLVADIAALYLQDRAAHDERARSWTQRYATEASS